jgi:tRNA (guanosine-2'-O-)-methyltransferase
LLFRHILLDKEPFKNQGAKVNYFNDLQNAPSFFKSYDKCLVFRTVISLSFNLLINKSPKVMDRQAKRQFLDFLYTFITQNKREHFERVVCERTKYITVVLEDIFQPHNASAVLRSCDVFGVQDVHIIENNNEYRVNPDVALGSSKWLNLLRYNKEEFNTPACLEKLKSEGYRIVATTPHRDDVTIYDLPLEKGKVALLFGTEYEGLTKEAIELADEYVMIPMFGFTESLNISVSAAIFLFQLTNRLRLSGIPWKLSEDEQLSIKIQWAKNVVRNPELLEKQFLKNYQKS